MIIPFPNIEFIPIVFYFCSLYRLIEQRGSELIYVLPPDHMPRYESLLTALEVESKTLGIRSYGLSDTTLEEVIEFDRFVNVLKILEMLSNC